MKRAASRCGASIFPERRNKNLFACRLPTAFGADSFYHIINGIHEESFRQLDFRNMNILEAESLVANFAVKVGVHIMD